MNGSWLDLGLIEYAPAFRVQEEALQARLEGFLPPTIVVQENLPVFTIGRAGNRSNLLASPEQLQRRGIEVLEVNRGGDITYHGPGQLIASPLLFLGDLNLNANQYLHRLEDLLIDLLQKYAILGEKKPDYPGVWYQGQKIASVGIAVRHGYTFHGFSINVNLDLEPFSLINPCGVPQMPVTSMQKVLGRSLSFAEVKDCLKAGLEKTFNLELQDASLADLWSAGIQRMKS